MGVISVPCPTDSPAWGTPLSEPWGQPYPAPQEITAGKNDGYGLRLDRGRGLVAFAFQRLEDCRGEAEV